MQVMWGGKVKDGSIVETFKLEQHSYHWDSHRQPSGAVV